MTERDPDVKEPMSGADGSVSTISPTIKRWTTLVAVLLVLWFFFAWLILDRHILDAVGESVGTAFVLGIVMSLIGALRGSR